VWSYYGDKMGVYITSFVDNNIFEQSLDYTINKMCKMLNKKLYLYILNDDNAKDPVNINEYIIVDLHYADTIDEEERIDDCMSVKIYDELYNMDVLMSKSSVEFYGMGYKWHFFEEYLRGENKLFDKNIEEIIHFSKIFNSTELLIFGDDYYQEEIEDKLLEGEKIKDVMNNVDLNIVTNIPIKNDDEIHVYYKTLENNNNFDYNEWIKYFIYKKSGHSA
jgi:hypothetical protein